MYSPAAEFERVSDPEVPNKAEMVTKKEVHVVRKLMDLGESMRHSSLGRPVFERVVAPEPYDMVSGKGG